MGPVTQLAVLVPTPAIHLPVADDSTGMAITGGEVAERHVGVDGIGLVPFVTGVIAKLSVAVVSPAIDPSIGRQTAAVQRPDCDFAKTWIEKSVVFVLSVDEK